MYVGVCEKEPTLQPPVATAASKRDDPQNKTNLFWMLQPVTFTGKLFYSPLNNFDCVKVTKMFLSQAAA